MFSGELLLDIFFLIRLLRPSDLPPHGKPHGQPLVTGQGNSRGALGMGTAVADAWCEVGILYSMGEAKSAGHEIRGCKSNLKILKLVVKIDLKVWASNLKQLKKKQTFIIFMMSSPPGKRNPPHRSALNFGFPPLKN